MSNIPQQRYNVVFDAAEADLIDNYWRASRLPTRSEAIRKLVIMGVALAKQEATVPPEHARAVRMMEIIERAEKAEGPVPAG